MDSKLEKNLFKAVINGNYEETELLLTLGANPNYLLNEGISSFHVAVGRHDDLLFTKLFLEHGANPNVKSIDDWTPLHVCACWNKPESLKLLLLNGANPTLFDIDCKSALHLAIECNNNECIDILKDYYYNTINRETSCDNDNTSNWVANNEINETSDYEDNFNDYEATSTLQSVSSISSDTVDIKPKEKIQTKEKEERTINVKDLEVLISNLIDLKLKEHSSSGYSSPQSLSNNKQTDEAKNTFETPKKSNRNSLTHQQQQQQQVTVTPPLALNYLKDKKYPIKSSPHYTQKNGTIYSKLKNWLNKVSNLNDSLTSSLCTSGISSSEFNIARMESPPLTKTVETINSKNDTLNERIIEDKDEKIAFKETTLLTSDNDYLTANDSTIYSWNVFDEDNQDKIKNEILKSPTKRVISSDIKNFTNIQLKREIESFGDKPGPVTKQTRYVYELRLQKLREEHQNLQKIDNEFNLKGLSQELIEALNGNFNLKQLEQLEQAMSKSFDNTVTGLREGHLKQSFTYILIDPRISDNLPARSKYMNDQDIFSTFIASIFYIGKGIRSRPYQHLYDTIKLWKNSTNSNNNDNKISKSRKIQQIMNIWQNGYGVVSLHCFQNVIPCEAFTREAAMIDAIGLTHLTNAQKSNYYGCTSVWSLSKKRQLGVLLLKKACNIFISEGERQIKPIDI